jgi:hypothetical protein
MRALIYTGEVIWVITNIAGFRCQVSGVRFQQPTSNRCAGVAYEMDFLLPVLIPVATKQHSKLRIGYLLTPDT